MRVPILFLTIAIGLNLLSPAAEAKDKKKKSAPREPQDSIEVVGHIPLANTPVTGFLPTQHYSSDYLYVEHGNGKDVTLLDVTNANQPTVLADVAYPSNPRSAESLFAVAGTAALTTEQAGAAAPAAQTIRIMDFSDPQQPKIAREFAGVTAMSKDEGRGLIYLANPEGIWILRRSFAEDPEVQKEYLHHVLYQ
jgi:hypothetical protein